MLVDIRPVPARSAVLSLLLGTHPPTLPVRVLVTAMEALGIAEATTRVAISRMVAAGDLVRDGSTYALSARLLERQRRQDEAVEPTTYPWDGSWEVVVVTAVGRSATERAALRTELAALRLAELREGTWMRPANLERSWPSHLTQTTRRLVASPVDDAVDLAGELWDLPAWTSHGQALLSHIAETTDPAGRFAAMAAVVRHLRTDPVLPPVLLPAGWPGDELRGVYAAYRADLTTFIPTSTA
jgi:phenylacetic acid degradation operon negative regulatory protein